MTDNPNKINVEVLPAYLADQSDPSNDHYVFSYTVTIRNNGDHPARLLRRHWIITDGDGQVQEVHGEGVIGEQPHIQPGKDFIYTSGTFMNTPVGTMRGSYQMITDAGETFEADIPDFTLAVPNTLH
ncbi:MAG: Co2+/Mg2+ efflux protein ApaG [Gammaproteobacteria bacterium]|nr:Co2+/Mg2+ efflux protein ApaG [Gammaproteobacteria bacterium]MCW8922383.1 Co2+/Mg2+ efflux protein ApaG [Gammaproteobacteria bacterium]